MGGRQKTQAEAIGIKDAVEDLNGGQQAWVEARPKFERARRMSAESKRKVATFLYDFRSPISVICSPC
jgi:hypothetical protein